MKNKIFILFFSLILALGAFFRIFWLSKSPPSLNWDEAALGYNAYSLLKTGKDEYGYKFPLTFRSFDDYKPPLYPYITVPFVAIFGLNEYAVRLPSAISGIFIIAASILIATNLFDKRTGLLAGAFFAIEPWSVHFSRAAFETNLGLALILWGIYFGLKIRKNYKYLYPSILLFLLSAYSYHSYRIIFLPILLLILIYNRKHSIQKKHLIGPSLLFTLLFIPLLFILKSGGGLVRLESTSIFKVVGLSHIHGVFPIFEQVFSLGKNVIGRYLAYFSPVNLFVRGTNEPNQQIHGFGVFYTIEFIFWIVGIIAFARRKFQPKILLWIILLAPVPAIITWNWFLPARVLLLFAMYTIIIGYGFSETLLFIKRFENLYKIMFLSIILIIVINSAGNLATTLFFYLPYMEKGNWQYGFRDIMKYISPIQDNYDKIIFETGHAQPHIFVLFYGKYPPDRYHNDLGSPDAVEKPRKNFNFGKYEFRNIYWPDDRSLKKTLFIGSEYSLPESDVKDAKNARLLNDIYDSQGNFEARIVATN